MYTFVYLFILGVAGRYFILFLQFWGNEQNKLHIFKFFYDHIENTFFLVYFGSYLAYWEVRIIYFLIKDL